MNSPPSLVFHVNYTFLSHLPNSNGEACSSPQKGAVGPQHNYSSFSFCQHSYYIWTSHDWVGRLFFKLILTRSFNSPKHIIIFSVLWTCTIYRKPIFNAWATCGILMCRLQAAEDLKPWATPWPCLATSSAGRFSPWLFSQALYTWSTKNILLANQINRAGNTLFTDSWSHQIIYPV